VATLARDKLLKLTDPIGPLLAATFKRYGGPADPRLETATVLNLITHRSGIPSRVGGNRFAPGTCELLRTHEPSSALAEQLLSPILKIKLTSQPGEQFQYSNVGYLLLGRIVEQATGKTYEDACNERVLQPSGITGARLHRTWGRLLDAAAGWEMSPAEYLAFARQLRPARDSVLGPEERRLIVKTDGFWRDDRMLSALSQNAAAQKLQSCPNNRANAVFRGRARCLRIRRTANDTLQNDRSAMRGQGGGRHELAVTLGRALHA